MKKLTLVLLFLATTLSAQSTINNDDSCDIALQPAATLLLPYFEVSPNLGDSETTLFSITNVSASPQIARVTLWTDYGYPVLTFNLLVPGYGVTPISLSDVLVSGVVSQSRPNPNVINPVFAAQPSPTNPLIDSSACGSGPSTIPHDMLAIAQDLLAAGHDANACGGAPLGQTHANYVGYATIDVVANCNVRSPLDPAYFTRDILFDNVLIGDYQQFSGSQFFGNTLVHIRAVPEGGPAGQVIGTALPYTFYDRLTSGLPSRTIDRRQPLPSTFTARWLDAQTAGFTSEYRIWREPTVGNTTPCSQYASHGLTFFEDIVRFDEHENATVLSPSLITPPPPPPLMAATNRLSILNNDFPPRSIQNDAGGWLYLNLNNGGSIAYSVTGPHDYRTGTQNIVRQSQGWMVTTLIANGFTVSNDATALGNGCSKAPPLTFDAPIAPAANTNP